MNQQPFSSDKVAPQSFSSGNLSHNGTSRRWVLGMLRDKETDNVPGSVLLLSGTGNDNKPLGLNSPTSKSPDPYLAEDGRQESPSSASSMSEKKRTRDGRIILEPQPDESQNDPLNWSSLRRDAALLSLGFYCMLGGGMTSVLAAGFTNVAETYDVSLPRVALTTGLYMMGLGVGSVIASPTAIAFGKRPVYLVASILFILTSIWCALSPNYTSLVVARVFMGLAVSPVECLPSATIAEIFFLHERAYRLGIYTLLLLGGKNLVPLASAAIIQSLGWRWVFWIVAMIIGFCFFLLFFFVPETFWDRTPRPHTARHRPALAGLRRMTWPRVPMAAHSRFQRPQTGASSSIFDDEIRISETHAKGLELCQHSSLQNKKIHDEAMIAGDGEDGGNHLHHAAASGDPESVKPLTTRRTSKYTQYYRSQPAKGFVQTLKPYSGRLNHDSWLRVAIRPFILFAYPAILWSSAVYALSVGWLIILSESVATIYRSPETYNFSAIQTGLVYLSPFIGGVLGTAVAGKVSDIVVRSIARRNGGIYEPEFRLFMGIPIAITTTIGLMGFGWSAQERDNFWVPTIFFGIISFGCCLGSTTAITFAVDSYRQYAGEALVTLNFSKNIFDGLVFSLFINKWLEGEGSKQVFICLGAIQLFFLLWTIPMYIFGKRARMWTVRKKLMERF